MASKGSQNRLDLSLIWPVLLVVAGLIWLLISIGLISIASLNVLVTYWPLLLIGIGLDYFLGRGGRFGIPYTLAALGLLLLLMLIGPALGLSRGAKVITEQFSEPLGDARSAQITLDLASAPTKVFALRGSANLIDAELTHIGTINFEVSGEQEKTVRLSRNVRNVNFGFGGFNQTNWDIGLSPELPIDLRIDVGSGRAGLELSDLNLSGLNLQGGSGSVELTLPASANRYEAEYDGGSGSSSLTVADRAELDLSVDVGSGSFTADLGDVDLTLELRGGSGSTSINLPRNAAARVEVRDDGSGSLNVRGGLERLSGSDDEGVWQSRNFEQAERQIIILVRDAGSGSISIR